jgi:hypothetical protein
VFFYHPEDDDDDEREKCLPSFTMILVLLLPLPLHAMCSTRACEKYRDVIEGYVINIFRVYYTCCCRYLSIFLVLALVLVLVVLFFTHLRVKSAIFYVALASS